MRQSSIELNAGKETISGLAYFMRVATLVQGMTAFRCNKWGTLYVETDLVNFSRDEETGLLSKDACAPESLRSSLPKRTVYSGTPLRRLRALVGSSDCPSCYSHWCILIANDVLKGGRPASNLITH